MSTKELSKVLIVVFQDSVSKERIEKYIADVVENGGKIKDRYFESTGGINGFSAIIEYFNTFKTFRADEINYIEADKEVVIQ